MSQRRSNINDTGAVKEGGQINFQFSLCSLVKLLNKVSLDLINKIESWVYTIKNILNIWETKNTAIMAAYSEHRCGGNNEYYLIMEWPFEMAQLLHRNSWAELLEAWLALTQVK